MRKKLLSILLVLGALEMYAQVGVGTEYPNISSQLDVVAENKGVLIPRVSLLNTRSQEPIVSDGFLPNGLIVFNTNTSGEIPDNVNPGIYYWLNGEWKRVISPYDIRSSQGTVIYDPQATALTYIDQDGESRLIDINTVVKGNETITSLVKNLDGSYTFTNEAGVAKRIDFTGDLVVEQLEHEVVLEKIESLVKQSETLTTLTYNAGTHTLNYKPERGAVTSLDLKVLVNNNETLTGLTYDAALHTLNYKDEKGNATTIDLSAMVSGAETLTALTYDASLHTLMYKAEDGNTTTFDLSALMNGSQTLTTLGYDAGTNALTYKAEDGNITTIDLSGLIGAPETLTRLDYNAETHTLTYRAEDGNTTSISLSVLDGGSSTLSALAYNPRTQELTYKAEEGTITTISLATLVNTPETVTRLAYDNNTNALVYTDENGTENVLNLPHNDNNPWNAAGEVANTGLSTQDIYHSGNVGFKNEAIQPTETIDVGSGNVRIREIAMQNGGDDDKIVVADSEGILKTLDRRDLGIEAFTANGEIEPWMVVGENSKARWNNQNIYQMGGVAIGTTELPSPDVLKLNINGSIRVGKSHSGTVGVSSALFGKENSGVSECSFVSGYLNRVQNGWSNHIVGGEQNQIANNDSNTHNNSIIGSYQSKINGSRGSVIVGGQNNTLNGANYGLVLGGRNSSVISDYGIVLSGLETESRSYMEVIAGPYPVHYTANSKSAWRPDDRLFVVANGTHARNKSNAITVLKSGNVGFKKEATVPSETIDVGSGSVRIREINGFNADLTDKIVAASSTGVLKTLSGSTLLSQIATAEPWQVMGGTAKATSNTENIYQLGSVAIGTAAAPRRNVKLNVVGGAVRIGTDHAGSAGNASLAMGEANAASGNSAFALGHHNAVSGDNSVTFGYQNNISGQGSFATGHHNNIIGSSSIAVGSNGTVKAESAAIIGGIGNYINAQALGSAIVGGFECNISNAEHAVVLGGKKGIANGNSSVVFGENNRANARCETIMGANALIKQGSSSVWTGQDQLFAIGNGRSEGSRSNAITVLKNGNTGFKNQAANPSETIDVGSGNIRIREINSIPGDNNDKIVVASATGILKTIDRASLLVPNTANGRMFNNKQKKLIEKQSSEIKALEEKLLLMEEKLNRLEAIIQNISKE